MRILIATDKPFSADAVNGMKQKIENAGHECVLLEKYQDKSKLLEAVKDVDAMIVRSDEVDSGLLDNAHELKIIVRAGAGYDNIDLEAAARKGIVVMNTPGQNANAVAELVFGMLLMSYRNFMNATCGRELKGKKIGLHAYGNVARNVARIAKGFGMEVYAYDAYCTAGKMQQDGVVAVDSCEKLYALCDVVSVHLPLTDATRGYVGYDLMKIMPENATLVNTARKEVVNEADLLRIMNERQDFYYTTDVKPDIDKALASGFSLRYFATNKKCGAQTAEANTNAGMAAVEQIIDYFLTGNECFRVN